MMTHLGFVLAAATLLTGAVQQSANAQVARKTGAPLDVVLVGGRVLDPETNLDAVRAVGIKGGRIVSVTTAFPRRATPSTSEDSSSRRASSISTRTARTRSTTSSWRTTA